MYLTIYALNYVNVTHRILSVRCSVNHVHVVHLRTFTASTQPVEAATWSSVLPFIHLLQVG